MFALFLEDRFIRIFHTRSSMEEFKRSIDPNHEKDWSHTTM